MVCNVSPKSTVILSAGCGIAQQRQEGCSEFKARLQDGEQSLLSQPGVHNEAMCQKQTQTQSQTAVSVSTAVLASGFLVMFFAQPEALVAMLDIRASIPSLQRAWDLIKHAELTY